MSDLSHSLYGSFRPFTIFIAQRHKLCPVIPALTNRFLTLVRAPVLFCKHSGSVRSVQTQDSGSWCELREIPLCAGLVPAKCHIDELVSPFGLTSACPFWYQKGWDRVSIINLIFLVRLWLTSWPEAACAQKWMYLLHLCTKSKVKVKYCVKLQQWNSTNTQCEH